MNDDLFKVFLDALSPKTLAYLARDLAANQADWQYYPEDAPSALIRQQLTQILQSVRAVGTELAQADALNFSQLLQQVTEEQQQEEWAWQRDRQERQNWTNDLE